MFDLHVFSFPKTLAGVNNAMLTLLLCTPVPETFESYLVNFEFWLNLTGNLTENRNCLKLNCKKCGILSNLNKKNWLNNNDIDQRLRLPRKFEKKLNFLHFNFKRFRFSGNFPVFNQHSKLTRYDSKVSAPGIIIQFYYGNCIS